MKNLTLIAACLLAAAPLAISPGAAQERREIPEARIFGAPETPADGDALIAAFKAYKTAWGAEDTEALIALHADDVEWINAYARMFRGAEPLAAFLEERLFPAFPDGVSEREAENMKLISTRYVGDGAAVIHLYTDGDRGPSVIEGETLRRTHLHLVWEKRDGAWKIVHTAVMDAR